MARRLNRAERASSRSGGTCPHQPIQILQGRLDDGQQFQPDAPDLPPCWCGRPRMTIQVIYDHEWRGPLPEGTQALRWPEEGRTPF